MVPLILAVVMAALVSTGAVGGGLFYMVKSGKLSLGGGGAKAEEAKAAEPMKFKLFALDPLLVNLADEDGHSYLRVTLTLKVEDPPPDKNAKPKEEKPEKGGPKNEFDAEERDAALALLGKEKSGDLLAPEGKEKLKSDLLAIYKQRIPEAKVMDVLITEFLVQR